MSGEVAARRRDNGPLDDCLNCGRATGFECPRCGLPVCLECAGNGDHAESCSPPEGAAEGEAP